MKVQFAVPLLDLEDNPVYEGGQVLMLNKLLASIMAQQSEGVDVIKFFDWARAIHKEEVIDLDRKDQETLKQFILSVKSLTILGKGRLLDCLEKTTEG